MTRDSKWWWVGIVIGVFGVLLSGELSYYGIPASWAPYLRLAFLILSVTSAKLGWSPLPLSENAKVDSMNTKIVPIILLALVLPLIGCSPKSYHVATVTSVSAHTTLALIQDSEKLAVCGLTTAPAPPACIPQDKHQQISAALVTAFDADGRLAQAIRTTPVDQPLPANAMDWITTIQAQVQRILALIPPGAFKDVLLSKLGGAK